MSWTTHGHCDACVTLAFYLWQMLNSYMKKKYNINILDSSLFLTICYHIPCFVHILLIHTVNLDSYSVIHTFIFLSMERIWFTAQDATDLINGDVSDCEGCASPEGDGGNETSCGRWQMNWFVTPLMVSLKISTSSHWLGTCTHTYSLRISLSLSLP